MLWFPTDRERERKKKERVRGVRERKTKKGEEKCWWCKKGTEKDLCTDVD